MIELSSRVSSGVVVRVADHDRRGRRLPCRGRWRPARSAGPGPRPRARSSASVTSRAPA